MTKGLVCLFTVVNLFFDASYDPHTTTSATFEKLFSGYTPINNILALKNTPITPPPLDLVVSNTYECICNYTL